ncbi:MAG: TetR/AcrR family transcriptional regulator [Propionibacteriales bacterium]|nr:TetR/AcrR family transcriptional regulator [Propionibacteriales bacterium]
MSNASDGGSQLRALRLLWGPAPGGGRGPRRGLTQGRIVEAAAEIADRQGLDGLTMRTLASELGVGVATLYTYVPGRPELLALILDQSIGQGVQPDELSGDWRDRLRQVAYADLQGYLQRPWMLQLLAAQPPALGPNLLAWYESMLRVMADSGLPIDDQVAALEAVDGYVRGMALAMTEDAATGGAGPDTERDAFYADHIDWQAHPLFAAASESGAISDHRANFAFGLERLLAGIAADDDVAPTGDFRAGNK